MLAKVFTAIINIIVGVAVISLLSGVGRSALARGRVEARRPVTARRDTGF